MVDTGVDGLVSEFMTENIMTGFSCMEIKLPLPFGIMVMLVACISCIHRIQNHE